MLQIQLCYLQYACNLKDNLNHQISLHLLRNERKLSNARMMPDSMCQSQGVATTHLGIRLVTCCEVKQLERVTNPLCLWCQAGTVDNAHNAIMEHNPVWLLQKTKSWQCFWKEHHPRQCFLISFYYHCISKMFSTTWQLIALSDKHENSEAQYRKHPCQWMWQTRGCGIIKTYFTNLII